MTQSDRAFRALAHSEPEVVMATLRVLAPGLVAHATPLREEDLLPTRLDALAPALDADWIAAVGLTAILHLECQGYRDAGFLTRLLRYHLLLTIRHPTRTVTTVALWLFPPSKAQSRRRIRRGDLTLRVTHLVLAHFDAEVLLASPRTACFAAGADAGAMSDEALCERVVAALAAGGASWYQRHMAVITAATKGRYETMTQAMERANMEPVIIEDFVTFGMERGEKIGRAEGKKIGRAEGKKIGRAEGKAVGRVEALLRVLAARGVALTEAQRAAVQACSELATLDRWITRAAICATAEEIFAPPKPRATRKARRAAT